MVVGSNMPIVPTITVESENGEGIGLQNRFLEPCLCGLEQRCPAFEGRGLFQADPPDPQRRGGAAPLHLRHQRAGAGRGADEMERNGIYLWVADGIMRRVTGHNSLSRATRRNPVRKEIPDYGKG